MKISGKLLAIMGGVTGVVVVSLVVFLVVIPKIKRNKFVKFLHLYLDLTEGNKYEEGTEEYIYFDSLLKKAYNLVIKEISDPGGWEKLEPHNNLVLNNEQEIFYNFMLAIMDIYIMIDMHLDKLPSTFLQTLKNRKKQ